MQITYKMDTGSDGKLMVFQFFQFYFPTQQKTITKNQRQEYYTGGSHLSCIVVKPDSHLAQIFLPNFLV